ncbi:uncharacterized protein LOC143302070 [Babylonia areolata]|uniref:uncharacterized protein LOC143302070 n=1 Tax=Babylonia areolata TaxID=304850 RepID=UPI003FD5DC79
MASIGAEDLKKMKVSDLKKELKDRGLAVSGTKDVLLERLQAAVNGAPIPAEDGTTLPADDVDNVEKSIDQLVGDAAPAEPVQSDVSAAPAAGDGAAAAAAAEVTSKENIPKTDAEPEKKVVSLKGLSEAERLKARAEKFGGCVSDSAKKAMRAERFGVQSSTTGSTVKLGTSTGDVDKLKKRAERFGTVVSNTLSKVDEDEKKRKRLERFGTVTSSSTSAPSEPKKVKLGSTDSDMEEKKRKRAERFGLT